MNHSPDQRSRTLRFIRDNSLTLAFLLLLLLALIGQAISGVAEYNQQQIADGAQQLSVVQYLTSSSFARYRRELAVRIPAVCPLHRGHNMACTTRIERIKETDDTGTGSDKEQKVGAHAEPRSPSWARAGGWRTALYGRSLGAIMAFFFLMSLTAQSIAAAPPQTSTASTSTSPRLPGGSTSSQPTSGTEPSKIGSRVPRRRLNGRLRRLPTPTRLTRIQTRRRTTRHHRRRQLTGRRRPIGAAAGSPTRSLARYQKVSVHTA